MPVEGGHGHEDHHCHQRGHRNQGHDAAQGHDEDEQEDAGQERGDPGAGAGGLDVDHGLPDHGAAAHAAEETGDEVGYALAPGLAGLGRTGVRDVVHELRRHQGFEESDEGHGQSEREDDLQSFQGERHVGDEERRKRIRQLALVADVGDPGGGHDGDDGQDHDGHERRRHGLGEPGQAEHDQQTDGGERVDEPRDADQLRDLGHEDQDGECVDEADHDRARDEAHQFRDSGQAQDDLEDAAEDHRGYQVIESVGLHQRCDDQGDGAGGGGNHGRPAADEGDGDGHGEGRKEPDPRVDAGDDRKRDGFGDECQRHDKACEDLGFESARGHERAAHGL